MRTEPPGPSGGRSDLRGRVIVMSGGSRGIGLSIALRAARDGACIALIAKTKEPHPKLEGTIYTAADQIEKSGRPQGHAPGRSPRSAVSST
jgi:citronellol/citronellal dehydrogenase